MSTVSEVIAKTVDGPVNVHAEVIGPFGIYPQIGRHPSRYYTVAHLPTGYAITNYARSRTAARSLARALRKYAWWDFTDPEAARAFSNEQMEIIRPLVRAAQPDWMTA